MSVCVSVCLSARISPEPHVRSLRFVLVAYVRGSILFRHVDDRPHRLSAGRGAQRGRSVIYDCLVSFESYCPNTDHGRAKLDASARFSRNVTFCCGRRQRRVFLRSSVARCADSVNFDFSFCNDSLNSFVSHRCTVFIVDRSRVVLRRLSEGLLRIVA